MNLVIDIGNTRTKFFVMHRGEVLISVPVDTLGEKEIQVLKREYTSLDKCILSATRSYPDELKTALKTHFDTFIELDEETPLPVSNRYQTKSTLGKDRIAAVVGANYLYPGKNCLVIDAGTALTYDIITDEGEYLGGNISPGLEMRFKALNHFTGKLPLVRPAEMSKLFGQNTEGAIRAGVQNGLFWEVDGAIETFKEFYKNLYVIITGGDAEFFDKKLKNSFFVHFNLIAFGLNRILEYNGEIQ